MQKGIKTTGYISGVGLFGNRHRIEGTVLSGGGVPELVLQRAINIDLWYAEESSRDRVIKRYTEEIRGGQNAE